MLRDIGLAYRQAFQGGPVGLPALPNAAEDVRQELSEDFVRPMADRLEERLGVDVIRVAELSTAYSFTITGQRVIAPPKVCRLTLRSRASLSRCICDGSERPSP